MGLEALQGLVQGQEFLGGPANLEGVEVRVFAPPPAPVLVAHFAAGVLDENAAHGLGGGREEVGATVPVLGLYTSHQPYVRLVDQRGRLQGLAGLFAG